MAKRQIVVAPYDEAWERDFTAISGELKEALGPLALAIEHVGSTAVRGLSAKPIIDVDVVIRDMSDFDAAAAALRRIGYRHKGDLGIAGREAFDYDGKEHLRPHHLYVCPRDSAELRRHLAFRDYLRAHPDAVIAYSRVKAEGAALYPHDIDGYIAHKSPFIEAVYARIALTGPVKIGVLSDTHGLLRPEVERALHGCAAILHGGDINRQDILDALNRIAPVYAVRGNNDKEWAEHIPLTLDFELAGLRVCMAHKKKDLPAELGDCDLAICGHTHRYEEARLGRTLLLNPGSCGPRRFNQPITLAILKIDGAAIDVRRVDIPHAGAAMAAPKGVSLAAQIETVMRETQKGRGPAEIARRHGWDAALVEQIARLYVTHPGVTVEGIMGKMGI